jgi:hypothetical protein
MLLARSAITGDEQVHSLCTTCMKAHTHTSIPPLRPLPSPRAHFWSIMCLFLSCLWQLKKMAKRQSQLRKKLAVYRAERQAVMCVCVCVCMCMCVCARVCVCLCVCVRTHFARVYTHMKDGICGAKAKPAADQDSSNAVQTNIIFLHFQLRIKTPPMVYTQSLARHVRACVGVAQVEERKAEEERRLKAAMDAEKARERNFEARLLLLLLFLLAPPPFSCSSNRLCW